MNQENSKLPEFSVMARIHAPILQADAICSKPQNFPDSQNCRNAKHLPCRIQNRRLPCASDAADSSNQTTNISKR